VGVCVGVDAWRLCPSAAWHQRWCCVDADCVGPCNKGCGSTVAVTTYGVVSLVTASLSCMYVLGVVCGPLLAQAGPHRPGMSKARLAAALGAAGSVSPLHMAAWLSQWLMPTTHQYGPRLLSLSDSLRQQPSTLVVAIE
jgi:hypothetical protein